MKLQLLCTFTDNQNIFSCLKTIKRSYEDESMPIDVYSIPTGLICIYNVIDRSKRIPDTISINKKKETNTFYSINALNALIMALNGGTLDKTYVINWHDYANSLLLSANNGGYKCLKLERLKEL